MAQPDAPSGVVTTPPGAQVVSGRTGRREASDREGRHVAAGDGAARDQDAAVRLQRECLALVVARARQQAHDAGRSEARRRSPTRSELGGEQPLRAARAAGLAGRQDAAVGVHAHGVQRGTRDRGRAARAEAGVDRACGGEARDRAVDGRGDEGAVAAHGHAVVDAAGVAAVQQRAVVREAVDHDAGRAERFAGRRRRAPRAAAVGASRAARHLHDGARAVELVGRAVPAVARLPGDDDAAVRALGDGVGRVVDQVRGEADDACRHGAARREARDEHRLRCTEAGREHVTRGIERERRGCGGARLARRRTGEARRDEASGAVAGVERPVGVEARERRGSGALARDDDAPVGLHDRRDANALRRPGEPLRVRADARRAAVEGRIQLAVGVGDRAARQCCRQDARCCCGTQPLSGENRHSSMKAAGPGSRAGRTAGSAYPVRGA